MSPAVHHALAIRRYTRRHGGAAHRMQPRYLLEAVRGDFPLMCPLPNSPRAALLCEVDWPNELGPPAYLPDGPLPLPGGVR